MISFNDKTAIVTGAGSGIGRALALEFADKKSNLAVTDISNERLERVVEEIKSKGVQARGYLVDHSKLEDVGKFKEKFFEDWGQVDFMCSNAGVGAGGRIEELTIEDWQWLMNINLWGAIYMVQLFVPEMIKRKSGSILITASGLGLFAAPAMAPYSTSKFALVGLAESLRCELHVHGIKVSALCPGIINTDIVKDGRIYIEDDQGASAKDKVVEFYKKWGSPPSVVARDALKGLAHDKGVIPSPLHAWPGYLFRRLSPELYQKVIRYVFKKGWIV